MKFTKLDKATLINNRLKVVKLLKKGLNATWQKVNAKDIDTLELNFKKWQNKLQKKQDRVEDTLTEFLLFEITQVIERINQLEQRAIEFNRHYLRASDEEEACDHIIAFCTDLGASKPQLRGDRKAFNRWFDRDAVLDRYQNIFLTEQKKLAFYLDRAGWVYSNALITSPDLGVFWQRFPLEEVLRPLFVFAGDRRVRIAAFNCLTIVLQALPKEQTMLLVGDSTLQYIYRASLEKSQDVQIQKRAISLLGRISLDSLKIVLQKRLETVTDGDDFFVRRHIIIMLGRFIQSMPELAPLFTMATTDPSPAVRQVIAKNLQGHTKQASLQILKQLILKDVEAPVRAASTLELVAFAKRVDYFDDIKALMKEALAKEEDSFVVRVLLKVAVDGLAQLPKKQAQIWRLSLLPTINELHKNSKDFALRQYAAETAEWFWLYSETRLITLYRSLLNLLDQTSEGGKVRLSRNLAFENNIELARLLSILAQNNFGLCLEKSITSSFLRKGDLFRFRWWRFIYELKNSSTDKRQAHRHTTGRHFYGRLRAPSNILCELAETKVPGEPLLIAAESSGRPFLPLVDDLLSALDQSWSKEPYTIVTSEGITEIIVPSNLFSRIRAQYKLTFYFSYYAHARNREGDTPQEKNQYVDSLQKLGFKITFNSHEINQVHNINTSQMPQYVSDNVSVHRFFPALFPFNFEQFSEQAKDYFFSVYENSLLHLGFFVLFVSSYFFGRHIILNRQMRRARKAIPLVIGGWGTRGKSGTERLKAALFSALGYSVVSKTSGCEAMFLHSQPFGTLREMFLFRPYDKATIWEQVNVVKLSANLNCDVFLWECMGLTPSYVHVLQKDWMQDDIATITNTYPDHEDLQGPAGHEIPRVMTNFIPKNSKLITTEEQMLPILEQSAKKFNTKITAVGWLQAGLLTKDVLDRFPYEEHPYNIALVLALAEEIDIEVDFALKEMADRVVADLGVLKTYPIAQVETRSLEFVMGMSANEKFGCMGNWTRMKFDKHSLDTDPQVWVTTVVNNRADRVPRSKVFAGIIANDVSVDRHILIGDNLQGLMGFIKDSWNERMQELSLFESDERQSAKNHLNEICRWLRIPISEADIKARYFAMLDGLNDLGLNNLSFNDDEGCFEKLKTLWSHPEKVLVLFKDSKFKQLSEFNHVKELVGFLQEWHNNFNQYKSVCHQLEINKDNQSLQSQYQSTLWSWFRQKLILVENYHASGNAVINQIVKNTPPGLRARIMGMQNIKGTGLDYVYRWQAWEECYFACNKVLADEPSVAVDGVKALAKFKEFGPLCEYKIKDTLIQIKERSWTQTEAIQSELKLIDSNLDSVMMIENKQRVNQDNNTSAGVSISHKIAEYLEAFLDAGDAVKRRKIADQIYNDLENKRISHQRASIELQKINKRQKGGWAGEYLTQFREDK